MSGSSSRAVRLPPSMLKFRFLQQGTAQQHTVVSAPGHEGCGGVRAQLMYQNRAGSPGSAPALAVHALAHVHTQVMSLQVPSSHAQPAVASFNNTGLGHVKAGCCTCATTLCHNTPCKEWDVVPQGCATARSEATDRYHTACPGAPRKALKSSCGVYRVRLRQSLHVQGVQECAG